ncbi:hypothetical protein AVEN_262255-1 [Araneus ventricosus]|uniref:Uncharacterized protein n=1 Tax=Araneus ventricosus TaxID=182803 RepID=A0A4Y2NLL2_ARAVE|nr:hypothetical protein AVEN_262255-1 [Araneus ventricosus]
MNMSQCELRLTLCSPKSRKGLDGQKPFRNHASGAKNPSKLAVCERFANHASGAKKTSCSARKCIRAFRSRKAADAEWQGVGLEPEVPGSEPNST